MAPSAGPPVERRAVGDHRRGQRGRAPPRRRRRVAARPDPDRRADRAGVVGRSARRRQRRRDRHHHRPGRRSTPASASPRRSTSCAGVAEELLAYGKVAHGWLGIEGADLSDAEADAHRRRRRRRGRAGSWPGSPADARGLQAGDVITVGRRRTGAVELRPGGRAAGTTSPARSCVVRLLAQRPPPRGRGHHRPRSAS